jgi:hypothetical protein
MARIKISIKVEKREWSAPQAIAQKSRQSLAGLSSKPVADDVRGRLRPIVLSHLETSMKENEELGKRLAE